MFWENINTNRNWQKCRCGRQSCARNIPFKTGFTALVFPGFLHNRGNFLFHSCFELTYSPSRICTAKLTKIYNKNAYWTSFLWVHISLFFSFFFFFLFFFLFLSFFIYFYLFINFFFLLLLLCCAKILLEKYPIQN